VTAVLIPAVICGCPSLAAALDLEAVTSGDLEMRAAGDLETKLFVALPSRMAPGAGAPFPPLHLSAIEPEAGGRGPGFIDERGEEHPGPSRGKTILLSALVPGLGQLLRGESTYGKLFLGGEAASWTSFAIFRVQGRAREDRYIEYAERFAGVDDAGGQDDSYYSALASYDRSGEPGGPESYNEVEVRQRARDELFPGDPEAQEAYIREHSIDGILAWDWETDARRREFAEIRISSENAYHRSEYAVGAMVANRILSVMHAIWLTSDDKGEETSDKEPGPSARPFADVGGKERRLGLRVRF
jgi:hypothetical protein